MSQITAEQVDSVVFDAKTKHDNSIKKCSRQKRYTPVYNNLNIDRENYKKIHAMKLKTEKEFPTISEWKALGDSIKLVYGIYESSS